MQRVRGQEQTSVRFSGTPCHFDSGQLVDRCDLIRKMLATLEFKVEFTGSRFPNGSPDDTLAVIEGGPNFSKRIPKRLVSIPGRASRPRQRNALLPNPSA
jgi:hypothetical protein